MGERIAAVDAYIAKAEPFARPILTHLRALVHAACPEAEESIKWGFPNFGYHGMLCSMAAFKRHASFGFWKHSLVVKDGAPGRDRGAMGSFGRITSLADLPPRRTLVALVRRAMKLNEQGIRPVRRSRPRPPLPVPADLRRALAGSRAAAAAWKAFPPGHRREYIEWIREAKTAPTRAKRLATTLEWLAEGKPRNWKYQRKR